MNNYSKLYLFTKLILVALVFSTVACSDQITEEIVIEDTANNPLGTDPFCGNDCDDGDDPGSGGGATNPPGGGSDTPSNPCSGGTECTGYGVFPDNPAKDCGWKRGYDDYVFHWNTVVENYELGDCSKLKLEIPLGVSSDPYTTTQYYANIAFIKQKIQQEFAFYISNLNNSDCYELGRLQAYTFNLGTEPITAPGDGLCDKKADNSGIN